MRPGIAVPLLAGALVAAVPAAAIPAFARRYRVSCRECHDIYPKLNAFGEQFKQRGFRMEGEAPFDVGEWVRSLPLVARVRGSRTFVEDRSHADLLLGKGIAAGNLGRRLSYWVDDSVARAAGETTHLNPDNAWARVEMLSEGKLYVKAGRFELDLPFTQVRTPHLFGYPIYAANTGQETDSLGTFKDGVETGGRLPGEAHWSVALVRRAHHEGDGLFDVNVYARAAKQAERHRFGVFAYVGQDQLLEPAALGSGGSAKDGLLRLGADGRVWLGRVDLYAVYLYGRNSQPEPRSAPQSFHGGFLQADYHARGWLALTLRGNLLDRPFAADRLTFASVYPGVQLWPWRGHVKVSFEYGFANQDEPEIGAVQAEVAF